MFEDTPQLAVRLQLVHFYLPRVLAATGEEPADWAHAQGLYSLAEQVLLAPGQPAYARQLNYLAYQRSLSSLNYLRLRLGMGSSPAQCLDRWGTVQQHLRRLLRFAEEVLQAQQADESEATS